VGVGPPVPLSSLVGRDGEVQEINARLQEHRLVTLTGPGGCGKTRLAVAVAAAAGLTTCWLDLAPVDHSGVAAAAASALGLERVPVEDLPAALAAAVDAVRGPHLLLVVDNAEHVVAAAATLVATLLARCPGLRVLATSRQPLGVGGELVWAVPALTPPPIDVTPDRLRDFAAARCFLERVEAASGRYPSRDETPVVARLCRRLDGMPLALELAAARTTALSVGQLDDRLSDALHLLTGGPRTSPDRHRTMRATLDWSYTLLDEPERVLLRRLAVFAGSFRLDAAEAVCGPGPTLDALTALVGHSLVTTTGAADGPRFRLLEVVRQYAAEKLADAGEAAELAERHAAHVARVMRVAETTLRPPVRPSDPRGATLARCEADHADLLAALQWAAGEPSRAVILAQLAASSWWFWWMCGHISTGARWMRRALDAARARGLPDEVLVELWHGAGWLARHLGDHHEAARLLQAAHDGYVTAGDALGESVTAHRMAAVAIAVDPALAVPHLDASAAAARRARDDWALACSSYWRGVWCRVDPAAAALVPDGGLALLRRAGELFVRCGDGWAVGRTHGTLAWTLVELGVLDEAATELVQARQLGELTQDRWGLALWSVHETLLHRARGDRRRAAASAAAALAAFTALGDRHETRRVLGIAADVAADLGDEDTAARLRQAAEELDLAPIPQLRAVLLGLAGGRDRSALPAGLSSREAEVLALVAEGLSDTEIGSRLHLSTRTVGGHLSSAYRKLGVRSRTAAVRKATHLGLFPVAETGRQTGGFAHHAAARPP